LNNEHKARDAWPLSCLRHSHVLALGYWPVALVQAGAFLLLACMLIAGNRCLGIRGPSGCGARGMGHVAACRGNSVYRFETGKAVLYWAANAAVFLVRVEICRSTNTETAFCAGFCGSAAALGLLAIVQFFTSGGRVSGYFQLRRRACWPVSLQEPCTAFVELVFPLACTNRLWTGGSARVCDHRRQHVRAVIAAVSRAEMDPGGELDVILLLAWRRGLIPAVGLRKTVMRLAALSVVLAAVVGWQVTLENSASPNLTRAA